jgi:hypothetical protein
MQSKFKIGTWVKTNEFYQTVRKRHNKKSRYHKMVSSIAGKVTQIFDKGDKITVILDTYPYEINQDLLDEWVINVTIN